MTSYPYPNPPQPWPSYVPPPWPPYAPAPQYAPRKPGVETRQVLLTLGAVCLVVALTAGTALIWKSLGRDGQLVLMGAITAGLLAGAATLRRLPATAEALAAVGLVGCAIDAAAARTLHLPAAMNLPLHTYVAVSGAAVTMIALALQVAAPRLVAAPLGWSSAATVAILAAVADATADTRALLAIALPLMAAAISVLNLARLPRVQVPAVSALAVPGSVAWISVAGATERFAVVNVALAMATAGVVALWPHSRPGASPVRNTAMGATTLFGSIAAGITLGLHAVSTPEAYVMTPAALLLGWGSALLVQDRRLPSAVLIPGLLVGLLPTLALSLGEDHGRQAILLVVATVIVCVGAELRLATPLAAGAGIIGLLSLRLFGPHLAQMPHWLTFGAAGVILLTLGATWDARLEDARTLKRSVQPRIEALR